MNRRIILSPDAEADIRSSLRWYQQKEPIFATRFGTELQAILRRLARQPFGFPLINDIVRRALMTRSPYTIYFKLSKNCVFVIAVLHQRRADTAWSNRRAGPQ